MITQERFHNLFRAHNAIANVLCGRTADGEETIKQAVSFTSDFATRQAAARQLRLILCHCFRVLDAEDVTPLTIKLLWYCTRTGRSTPSSIDTLPIITIIRAIKHAPHLVRGRSSLVGILKHYNRQIAQERATKLSSLRHQVPMRTLLWTDGVYTFEEANDPRHLVYDSLTLGHCVGTLHLRAALAHQNITSSHPDAINYLHYWIKIKNGRSRIITLIERNTPRITVEFDVSTCTILAAQGAITPMGELLPVPASAKIPFFEAVKVLPVRKGGGRLLRSLIFEPDPPKLQLQRITRFTPL